MNLSDLIKKEIKEHALSVSPQECCGYIVSNQNETRVVRCRNIALNPIEDFQISPLIYVRLKKFGYTIEAVYHSHAENPNASNPDITNSEGEKLTHIIYIVSTDRFVTYEPKGKKSPYLGRKYELGKSDCLTLAIDYYKAELGVSICDPYSQRSSNEFFENSRDIIWTNKQYLEDIIKAGFELVIRGEPKDESLRVHDAILTSFYNSVHPSHILIYQGNGRVLHQPRNNYSLIEEYSDYLKQKTYGVIRYAKRAS